MSLSVILSPSQYSESSAYDLLKAAASGHVGIDRRFIRAIVDRGPSVLPELLRFAAEERSSDLVDLDEELIGFFRHFRAPEAVPYLVELVRSQPEDIPDDVVQALVELGEPAVEPLLALYEELDAEDNDIPFLLASLRVRHPRVTALLTDRLTYDPMDAAFCLELYADPATRPALEETLASLGEYDHEVRRAIEEALSRIDTSEPAPLLEPFDIWEPYSEEDTPHFDVLSEAEKLAFLESPEPQYRAGAAASLGKDDISERAAARVLELAENDPDPEVRGECWEALGAWAVDKEPVRQKMRKRVEDTSAAPVERASALVALTSDAEDDFVHDWLLEFYHLPEIRWKALEGMWRSFNPRYVGFFPKHLDDADLNLRREAIWGIGHLRIQAEAGRLRDLFQDDDLRTDALYNYAVAWPGDVARSRARSLLRRIEDWAGGLSIMEAQIVQTGLDERLVSEGMRPVFSISEAEQEADLAAETAQSKTGRNDPCPCGSGKKYKKCCGQ